MKNLIRSLTLVGVLTVVGAARTQAGILNPFANPNLVCYGQGTTCYAAHFNGAIYFWYLGANNSGTLVSSGQNNWTLSIGADYVTATWCVYAFYNGTWYGPETFVVTVNNYSGTPTSATANPSTICSGGSTVLTLNGGGGGGNETIKWYTSSCGGTLAGTGNNLTVSPTTTTTYYGRYEDGAPCNYNTPCAQVTVTVNPVPSAGSLSPTAVSVCSGSGTAITLSGYSPGASIQWYSSPDQANWTPISGANAPAYNTPGLTTLTYYAACVNLNGCGACVGTTTVTINATPSAPTASNGGAVCEGQTLNLYASVVSGAAYSWTGPNGFTSLTQNPTISGATTAATGTYSVTATVNGCTSAAGTIYATVNPSPTVSVNSAAICAGGSAMLTATTSASNPGYLWNPGGATTASISVSPSAATIYTVTVTDGTTGCANSGSGTVTVSQPPTVTADTTNQIACAGSPVTWSVAATGTSLAYHWQRDGTNLVEGAGNFTGTTTATLTNTALAAQDAVEAAHGYACAINSGACTVASTPASLTVNPLPTASVNSETICAGGSATLTATSDAANPSYLWSPGGETTASITASPSATTTYTVTVTDGTTSCANNGSGTVTVSPQPTASVNSETICAGGVATLTTTTSASSPGYLWSPGGATTASITVSPSSTTTYTVTVTDGTTGCTNSGSGTVTVNPLPTLITDTTNQTGCAGSSVTWLVAAAGTGLAYQWQRDGTNLLEGVDNFTGTTTAVLTNSAAASQDGVDAAHGYACVISIGPCSVTSTRASLAVNPPPTVSVLSWTICAGGAATLTATTDAANPSYLWSPGGETTASITVSPSSTTTYTVTVTDGATGCASSASGSVTVYPPPTASVNSAAICPGSSATLTATSDATSPIYLWSPGGETTASITVSPSSTTTYTVTVTDDATSCYNNGSGTVTVNPHPTASAGGNRTVCSGSPMVIGGNPTASGGTGPYTYSWSPAAGLSDATAANPTATVTSMVTYTVTVTDHNGCTANDSAVLTFVPQPEIASITVSGTEATLVWSSLAGQTYRVQRKTGLDEAGWTDVPGNVLAAGATATKTVSVGAATQQFYRISVVCP